jgi:hypothetical protein
MFGSCGPRALNVQGKELYCGLVDVVEEQRCILVENNELSALKGKGKLKNHESSSDQR